MRLLDNKNCTVVLITPEGTEKMTKLSKKVASRHLRVRLAADPRFEVMAKYQMLEGVFNRKPGEWSDLRRAGSRRVVKEIMEIAPDIHPSWLDRSSAKLVLSFEVAANKVLNRSNPLVSVEDLVQNAMFGMSLKMTKIDPKAATFRVIGSRYVDKKKLVTGQVVPSKYAGYAINAGKLRAIDAYKSTRNEWEQQGDVLNTSFDVKDDGSAEEAGSLDSVHTISGEDMFLALAKDKNNPKARKLHNFLYEFWKQEAGEHKADILSSWWDLQASGKGGHGTVKALAEMHDTSKPTVTRLIHKWIGKGDNIGLTGKALKGRTDLVKDILSEVDARGNRWAATKLSAVEIESFIKAIHAL